MADEISVEFAPEKPKKARSRKRETKSDVIIDMTAIPSDESISEFIMNASTRVAEDDTQDEARDERQAQAGEGGGGDLPPEGTAEKFAEMEPGLPVSSESGDIAKVEESKGRKKPHVFGQARVRRFASVSFNVPEKAKKVIGKIGRKLATPASIGMFLMMFAAMGFYLYTQWSNARDLLSAGPARAYALAKDGHEEAARQLWIQINAKAPWYMIFSGLFTNIDSPYLQKASLAYKAEDWPNVAENAYKALRVPITNQQAVFVQQMILTATANMVKAYLPNQHEQPIRGGIPDHEPPVCEPSTAYIWVIPAILVLLAGVCLYGKMKVLFAVVALIMPVYFWGVNTYNSSAIKTCEMRLNFNPARIDLYNMPSNLAMKAEPLTSLAVTPVPVAQAPKAAEKVAAVTAVTASVTPVPVQPQPAVESKGTTNEDLESFIQRESPLKIKSGNAPAQPKK